MIAKGVRFNAEKSRIGKYMSTTIWQFVMNCPACSNKIMVHTDPENTDYKYVEGAKRILNTEKAKDDVIFMRDEQDRVKLQNDPFYNLENKIEDQNILLKEKPRINNLIEIQKVKIKKQQEKKEEEEKKPKNFGIQLLTVKDTDIGYTKQQVAQHNNENDAWIIIQNKIYDVTGYLNYHPGGKHKLMLGVGKDGTMLFDKYHSWFKQMENLSRFDDYYFTICKETGGIEGVLHSMFNFLYRRTDFFYEADPGDKMGFLPGVSQQLLNKIFMQYQNEHYKRFPKKDLQESAKKLEEYKKKLEEQKDIQRQNTQQQQTNVQQKQINSQQNQEKLVDKQNQNIEIKNNPLESQKQSNMEENKNEYEKKHVSLSISTYNGGVNDKYKWSQSITDVTVEIQLPKNTRAKDVIIYIILQFLKRQIIKLIVNLNQDKFSIKLKKTNEILIQGEYYEKIKIDDSTWNIDDDFKFILTLEKGIETIWKTVFKGDPEIDATKVDNTKPLDSFDNETQSALRKIMYEQQRKQMGLPTSEEEKQLELLKNAWNAEGSPFKGQPFDPSKLNMNMGGMNIPSQ
ncbi:nuclear movement protein related, putative [Ichthyophthirius multifiliis]|uniref:Nuclear migration protein nudC n=1 Tax=Ichthyophthirius multifiliis TaxID=5932 RepID=G0R3Y7_ICHMU|nr:nuclear movement protein related, putative [Ichthyophthirius multifiliis]EGR27818.1 nuclear movement protein related, putative [Ichthyophthirius multifiliis]|eukprot:XP_004027163.1 nuclear movement protein related, putative [Ichthyophthirius multifiliis]